MKKHLFCSLAPGFLFFLLVAAVPVSESFAQLRDEQFIRQHAQPYVNRFLKELEAYERDLHQGKGDRGAILIRLSRVCSYLGELAEHNQRLRYYEKGRSFAELLLDEQPSRMEGHYWLGVNLGGVAEVGGAGRALRLLPELIETFGKAASMDQAYDQAGAHRALGSIFCEAPPWPISVGDLNQARQHLTSAVRIAPKNSTNHLYLGHTLMNLGRLPEARAELQRVFQATTHSVWPPGVEHDRREARRLLKRLSARAKVEN